MSDTRSVRRRKKRNKGWFRKGPDPRRHPFTRAERQRGYRTTEERYIGETGDDRWLFWRVCKAARRRRPGCESLWEYLSTGGKR